MLITGIGVGVICPVRNTNANINAGNLNAGNLNANTGNNMPQHPGNNMRMSMSMPQHLPHTVHHASGAQSAMVIPSAPGTMLGVVNEEETMLGVENVGGRGGARGNNTSNPGGLI